MQLLLDAVQEYGYNLVHGKQRPVRGFRGREAREAERERWVAERREA